MKLKSYSSATGDLMAGVKATVVKGWPNPGDIVELASGGPAMTVVGRRDDGKIECIWFADDKQQPLEYAFSAYSLRGKQK